MGIKERKTKKSIQSVNKAQEEGEKKDTGMEGSMSRRKRTDKKRGTGQNKTA